MIPVVNDLFLGRASRYSVSFSLEHTSLTDLNVFNEFNWIGSYPLSRNEISFPLILVPVTDLITADVDVEEPGVLRSYVGTIELYKIFSVARTFEPPNFDSEVNDNCGASARDPSVLLLVLVPFASLLTSR